MTFLHACAALFVGLHVSMDDGVPRSWDMFLSGSSVFLLFGGVRTTPVVYICGSFLHAQ